LPCVWPLFHPVAELKRGVIDKAYQDQEGRRSSQEGRQYRANREDTSGDVVARLMLMHRGIYKYEARTKANGERWQRARMGDCVL
jgi:hypothetical protein